MIVLSVGMQKSGSAFFYNIINELEIASGGASAHKIKSKYQLQGLMQWDNNNIGRLHLYKLIKLWRISLVEGDFVVKSHSGPGLMTRNLSRLGVIKVIYCYRDPRDVLLSAVDHGKKIIANGENHTFAEMVDFDRAIFNVRKWLNVWKRYAKMPGILMIKYEDMMADPFAAMETIEAFLDISISNDMRKNIVWKFSKHNPQREQTGMHFNKANTYRYKTEMTQDQKKKFQKMLGSYLPAMRYDVN